MTIQLKIVTLLGDANVGVASSLYGVSSPTICASMKCARNKRYVNLQRHKATLSVWQDACSTPSTVHCCGSLAYMLSAVMVSNTYPSSECLQCATHHHSATIRRTNGVTSCAARVWKCNIICVEVRMYNGVLTRGDESCIMLHNKLLIGSDVCFGTCHVQFDQILSIRAATLTCCCDEFVYW